MAFNFLSGTVVADSFLMSGTLAPADSDLAALGSTSKEWKDLYLADAAAINLGDDQDVTLTHVADTGVLLNSTRKMQFGDAGTFIHQSADGVLTIESDTTVDINGAVAMNGALTGLTSINVVGTITGDTSLTLDTTTITTAELAVLDGVTAGAAAASKALVLDASANLTSGLNNLTVGGNLTVTGNTVTNQVEVISTSTGVLFEGGVDDGHEATLKSAVAGADVTYTLPNVTGYVPLFAADPGTTTISSTPAELNIMDGGTSATSTTLVAADRVPVNDNGTMVQVAMSDFETFMESNLDTLASVTTVGALNAGSISSGFGNIDNGSSTLDTGVATLASLVCSAGATFGGGYGSTGATISTAGVVQADGAATFGGALTCATSLTIGSAAMSEADLEKLDGITNGAAAANKAVVLDGNLDFDGMRNLTMDGSITAGANLSLDSGTTNISSAELNVLDSVTAGTAAASKAVVLDASKNIATIGTLGCGAITSTGNSTFGRVQIDSANDYIDVSTDMQLIAAADILLDPAGGDVKVDGNLIPNSDSADDLGASGTAWANLYVDAIDLNGQGHLSMGGGKVQLDADDDTFIYAGADDVISFAVENTAQVNINNGEFYPETDSDIALGKAAKRFSTLYVDSLSPAYAAKTSAYTIDASTDFFVGVNTSGGAVIITLPASSAAAAGKIYVVKDIGGVAGTGGKNITITPNGSDRIDGIAASRTLNTNHAAVNLMSDGSNWFLW
tara:strand:- start:286 stop:2493 length:2208 start_codon:yes stop_codon:yes gene_type:complete